jgi:ketosteroid isomerase-like protein
MVRRPLRVRENTSRTLDQRLAIRIPALFRAALRLLSRLPPSSRLRQALLWPTVQRAIEAYNRRDLDAVAVGFHPRLEYHPYREFVEAGLTEPSYHGPEGYKAYIRATYEVWGGEVRLYPTELIDMGDQVVLLADMPMRAQASGVALSEHYATIATLQDGMIIRQRDFLDQAEALREAGVPPRSAA